MPLAPAPALKSWLSAFKQDSSLESPLATTTLHPAPPASPVADMGGPGAAPLPSRYVRRPRVCTHASVNTNSEHPELMFRPGPWLDRPLAMGQITYIA